MDTNGHYDVHHGQHGIDRIACGHCPFAVSRSDVSGANAPGYVGGRSGTPRYNRMRAKIVKHLHAEHRDKLAGPRPIVCDLGCRDAATCPHVKFAESPRPATPPVQR